jgi:hypothetical protein
MKNFSIYLIAIVLIAFSCSQALDIEAEGTISGDVLNNTENIERALEGAYFNFTGISDGFDGGELIGGDFILMSTLLARVSGTIQEIRWESVLAPNSYLEVLNKEILNTNGRVAVNWRRAYETINAVNNILANLDNIEDATVRQRIEGEAKAIRGILYFQMALFWAPHYTSVTNPATVPAIPIRIDPITDINEIPELSDSDLASLEEVYNQAQTDLSEASAALQSFGANGTRLSYYACQAYLTRLHLQKGEYSEAEDAADNVINGPFSLMPTPMDAFNNPSNSQEDVFAVQQTLANNTGDRTSGIGVTAYYSSLPESGLGVFGVLQTSLTSDLFANTPAFSDNDLRGTVDNNVNQNTTAGQINTAFYQNIANNFSGLLSTAKYKRSDNVLPIVRLAEMYLSRAEAAFEAAGASSIPTQALSDLNMIRTRAGLPALQNSDFADPLEFFDSLVIERKRELIYEGHLLHDLKRWRTFDNSVAVGINFAPQDPWDDEFIFPIPQSERDTWGGN